MLQSHDPARPVQAIREFLGSPALHFFLVGSVGHCC